MLSSIKRRTKPKKYNILCDALYLEHPEEIHIVALKELNRLGKFLWMNSRRHAFSSNLHTITLLPTTKLIEILYA